MLNFGELLSEFRECFQKMYYLVVKQFGFQFFAEIVAKLNEFCEHSIELSETEIRNKLFIIQFIFSIQSLADADISPDGLFNEKKKAGRAVAKNALIRCRRFLR
jgi:hypothetical protein